MLYSIRWERLPSTGRKFNPVVQIRTTFLDENGTNRFFTRNYTEWIGVCTHTIDKVVQVIAAKFPGCTVHYEQICFSKKILPYFEQRLQKGKLDYRSKPFYKVYTSACHEDVGKLFRVYKVSYYRKADWLVRLYIDLCTRYNSHAFYYKWYDIQKNKTDLLDSFVLLPDRTDPPNWTIGAFDIETVPMDGATDRIPSGLDPTDTIVMISLFKWNRHEQSRYLLYLAPPGVTSLPSYPDGYVYHSEKNLLLDFHQLIDDCHVLTGYNITGFDIPCIFSRVFWLQIKSVLKNYSSFNCNGIVVTTFKHKLIVDLYNYVQTFSSYDLPSFKLDDVAHIKLDGLSKVQIKSTGIWCWYTSPLSVEWITSSDVAACHAHLQPHRVTVEQFGTFRTFLDYCLKDSELVRLLFLKEDVLSFLVERANFTALDVTMALFTGPNQYLLEMFKTFGTRLGFFFNESFFKNPIDVSKYESTFIVQKNGKKTFQGALNFAERAGKFYHDVSLLDFASMYPTTLLNMNLCYGSCTILTRDEWLELLQKDCAEHLIFIPYRIHSDECFQRYEFAPLDRFSYPPVTEDDAFVIVVNPRAEAFLPSIVKSFIDLRKHHQRELKRTGDIYHHNAQLCIKIMINSLYGVMANPKTPLYYIVIAIIIVTLARCLILAVFHLLKRMGSIPCYVDTDGLMVAGWPTDDCQVINEYLNLDHIELQFERRMKRFLIITKKRYIYETQEKKINCKGLFKKTNDLIDFIWEHVRDHTWDKIFRSDGNDPVNGWLLWIYVMLEAQYRCRDPKKFSVYRKVKSLEDYRSKSCQAVKLLQKYPDSANTFVDMTYGRADIGFHEAKSWVMKAEDCQWLNFEKLFTSQKKTFVTLIKMAYWRTSNIEQFIDMISNTIRWKLFVHAELLHYFRCRQRIIVAVERKVKYTFRMNDHLERSGTRGRQKKDPDSAPSKKVFLGLPKKQRKVDASGSKGSKKIRRGPTKK